MKNITLAAAIMLGFCATEIFAQTATRGGRSNWFRDHLREQRDLQEQRQQIAEFDALMTGGKLQQLEEELIKAQLTLERMSALEDASKMLSDDALAIYDKRLKEVKREYKTCSNQLARARAMLTPEKISDFEKKKKAIVEIEKTKEEEKMKKQRAEAEYRGFAAAADDKISEKENEIHEKELWSTWPEDVYWCDTNIMKKCENEFKVVFYGEDNDAWERGRGKHLIFGLGRRHYRRDVMGGVGSFLKFNSEGILIQAGNSENSKEYVWMTNCAACVTAELRKKWASEHGMTYDEAMRKMESRNAKLRQKNSLKKDQREIERAKQEAEREKRVVEALSKVCEAEKKQ